MKKSLIELTGILVEKVNPEIEKNDPEFWSTRFLVKFTEY